RRRQETIAAVMQEVGTAIEPATDLGQPASRTRANEPLLNQEGNRHGSLHDCVKPMGAECAARCETSLAAKGKKGQQQLEEFNRAPLTEVPMSDCYDGCGANV